MNKINPIIKADFPDPDVIRVEDTYYMLSTTKHFMPGAVILRSFDLKQWEIASYVFKTLDNTSEEKMEGEKSNYGHGMWAGSLRYHNGKFYVTFVARETEKTYLYTSENIEGPWKKQYIEGYYHASSLLFDEDRIFILYGYKDLWITELERDLSGPKLNGFTKMVASNIGDAYVHYEGAHFYKIDGRYYFFVNTWPKDGSVRRIQWCFMAHTLEDDFVGKIVIDHDRNFYNQGIAQGGIVDTPWGNWYGIFFQDHGAVGRIQILLPMQWENEFPKFQ